MKKIYLIGIILFAVFTVKAYGQIVIDASNIKSQSLSVNLKKPFTVEFRNNKAGSVISILKTDKHSFIKVKTNFSTAEQAGFKMQFNSDGKTVRYNLSANDTIVAATSPMQIKYNQSIIAINYAPPKQDTTKKPKALLVPASSQFGIEIHDAIAAKQYYQNSDKAGLLNLLVNLKGADSSDPAAITAKWENNPFINPLLNKLFGTQIPNEIKAEGGGLPGFISSVGNTDVTTVVDGIAKFLVKRTKQELSVNFFQHFKELLNDPKYQDVQFLFPKTVATLNNIDQNIYQYANYINTLRSSFAQDFNLLLDNMPRVVNEGTFKDYFAARPDLKYSALLSIFTAKEMINSTHPGKILETLPQEDVDGLDPVFSGSIKTVQLFSMSIRARGSNDQYWTSLDTLKMLIDKSDKDFVAANFYLGFLYEKANTNAIGFGNGKLLTTYLNSLVGKSDSIKKYITYIEHFGELTHNVEASLKQIKAKTSDIPTAPLYHRLFDDFANVLTQVYDMRSLPYINTNIKVSPVIGDYITTFKTTNDLAMDLTQRDYAATASDAYNVYLQILQVQKNSNGKLIQVNPKENGVLKMNTVMAAKAKASKPKVQSKPEADADVDIDIDVDFALDNVSSTVEFVMKYGTFMANMVEAENSDDIEAAIESVALPVGSASIKKHSDWSVALNAYVGPYIGMENIKGVDDKYKLNAYGITAPIGFSISRGINTDKPYGWSVSAFVSVIDLGAPVAFRFADDKTSQIPSIKLEDIVSPGLFLSFGLPKVPISINTGWQMGPLLRKLTDETATNTNTTYGRFSISFVVDIPVFNFYKSAK